LALSMKRALNAFFDYLIADIRQAIDQNRWSSLKATSKLHERRLDLIETLGAGLTGGEGSGGR